MTLFTFHAPLLLRVTVPTGADFEPLVSLMEVPAAEGLEVDSSDDAILLQLARVFDGHGRHYEVEAVRVWVNRVAILCAQTGGPVPLAFTRSAP